MTFALPADCIGGSRAVPPEDCGGPLAYMELLDHYNPAAIQFELYEILEKIKTRDFEEDEESDLIDRLTILTTWCQVNKFPRAKINQRLKRYFSGNIDMCFDDEEW